MLDFQMSQEDLLRASQAAEEAKKSLLATFHYGRATMEGPEETQAKLRRTMQNHIKAMEERQMRRRQEMQDHRTTMHTGPARTVDHR